MELNNPQGNTVIVDYGMGNLRSVQKALEELSLNSSITDDHNKIKQADLLIVPGVGAFDEAVENLREKHLWEPILRHLDSSKPYLGICLGYQLLFENSEEGKKNGFSFYEGEIRQFRNVKPVPHMGWNAVDWINEGASLSPDRVDLPCYYFVHSYYPCPEDSTIIAGRTDYGQTFASAIRNDNVLGVQFHPEKSQFSGLSLINAFIQENMK